jgi:hypothetical protein
MPDVPSPKYEFEVTPDIANAAKGAPVVVVVATAVIETLYHPSPARTIVAVAPAETVWIVCVSRLN